MIWKAIRPLLAAAVAVTCGAVTWSLADYTATQGSGVTFYAGTVNGKQVPGFLICDPTTAAQCVVVNASGQLSMVQAAGSVVSGAYLDGNNATLGRLGDPVAIAPASNPWTMISLLKGILNALVGTINVNCTGCTASPQVQVVSSPNVQFVNSNNSALVDANTNSQIHSDLTASVPAGGNLIGYVSGDYCAQAGPASVISKATADFFSQVSGGSIINAVAGKKVYICSLTMVTSAATTMQIVEGTGASVCTGGTIAAMLGSTDSGSIVAAHGMAITGNGLQVGMGGYTIAQSGTPNQNVCVVFNTATTSPQVNVHAVYVQQ